MKRIFPAALALALVLIPAGAQASAVKVTICHATGSESNPYVQISPSAAGVYNGHLGAGHQGGEDIIPPFVYKGTTYSQNWDAEGQAIFAAGCKAPDVEPVVPEPGKPKPDTRSPKLQTAFTGSDMTAPAIAAGALALIGLACMLTLMRRRAR